MKSAEEVIAPTPVSRGPLLPALAPTIVLGQRGVRQRSLLQLTIKKNASGVTCEKGTPEVFMRFLLTKRFECGKIKTGKRCADDGTLLQFRTNRNFGESFVRLVRIFIF